VAAVDDWRDNLAIGIFLGGRPYGAPLEDVLIYALGYNPQGTPPTNDWDRYERRLRAAQALGNEKYAQRIPGYFTIHAQPFGTIFVYKVVWYVWTNPQTHENQAVLITNSDLAKMTSWRAKDLDTRVKNVRAIRTADHVQQYREAIGAGDITRAYAIQASMAQDDSFAELLTNQLGIEYNDIAPVIEQVANKNPFNTIQFSFTKTAKKMLKLQNDLKKEQAQLVNQLTTWINIQTGLPPNAAALALQDAAQRYAQL
jgi:hypothetical protein